jgi:hypothetical protein
MVLATTPQAFGYNGFNAITIGFQKSQTEHASHAQSRSSY